MSRRYLLPLAFLTSASLLLGACGRQQFACAIGNHLGRLAECQCDGKGFSKRLGSGLGQRCREWLAQRVRFGRCVREPSRFRQRRCIRFAQRLECPDTAANQTVNMWSPVDWR